MSEQERVSEKYIEERCPVHPDVVTGNRSPRGIFYGGTSATCPKCHAEFRNEPLIESLRAENERLRERLDAIREKGRACSGQFSLIDADWDMGEIVTPAGVRALCDLLNEVTKEG